MLNVVQIRRKLAVHKEQKNRYTCRVAMVTGHGQDMKVSVRGVRV